MARRLLLFSVLLLSGAFAFVSEARLGVAVGATISGGSGTVTVLEYPRDFPRQTAQCTDNRMSFPPYFRTVNCTVDRWQARDFSTASYGSTPLVEADPQIISLAESMRSKSVFETSVKLADWVFNNIEYNLDFGELQKNASETYRLREGTCDEFTHLFLALVKSLGYDARYVSGFAYGDSGWLPHAWAEVRTEYGWMPFDTTFGEYGIVDALHVATYKGADGNSSFVQATSTGSPSIQEYYDLRVLSTKNISFGFETSATDTGSGQAVLIEISAHNPFGFPVAFASKFFAPSNFRMIPIYKTDYIRLNPGGTSLYWVYRVPNITDGSLFQVPYRITILDETANSSFRVGGAEECTPPQRFPDKFNASGCVNVETGEKVNGFVDGGMFMCGACFYELIPKSELNYTVNAPSGCYEPCELKVELDGMSYVNLTVDNESRSNLLVRGPVAETFSVLPGSHRVVVNGEESRVLIEELPKPEFHEEWNGRTVCLVPSSGWEFSNNCFQLSCGGHEVRFSGSYRGHRASITATVDRQCGFFCRLLEKVISFLADELRG